MLCPLHFIWQMTPTIVNGIIIGQPCTPQDGLAITPASVPAGDS